MSIDYLKLGYRFNNIDKFYQDARCEDEAIQKAFTNILCSLFPKCLLKYSSKHKVKSYSNVMTVVDLSGVVVGILAAPKDLEHVLIQVSGGHSKLCKNIINSVLFSESSCWVMRIDIAYDIYETDLSYDKASKYIADFCKENRLAESEQSSYTACGKLKRTQYGGARSSYSMCRFYEKSVQINDTFLSKWNRFEFEIKPTKEKRNKQHKYDIKADILAFLKGKSLDVFCYSKLGVHMSEFINSVELEQLTRTEKHYSEAVNSVSYMFVQYHKKIQEVLDNHDITLEDMFTCVIRCKELGYTDAATINRLSELCLSKSKQAKRAEVPLSLIGGTPQNSNLSTNIDFDDFPF